MTATALEYVWPAAQECTRQPFRSRTWIAALAVIVDRDHGGLARTRRLGPARFERTVHREITRRGGQRPSLRILRRLFTALTDPAGVTAGRRGGARAVPAGRLAAHPAAADRGRNADDQSPR